MRKTQIFVALICLISTLIVTSSPAIAATKVANSSAGGTTFTAAQTGNDVSWPQCASSLPKGQLFGIVGVNDGLANTTNPCFTTELAWANSSIGLSSQPRAALYVNTADPGNLGVSDWPTTGANAYGICTGGNTQACAYQYGWNMARADTGRIGTNNPSNYKWWLDVEINNSWETVGANNVADLEGMIAYLQSIDAVTGLYSTAAQWGQIVGKAVSSTSNLNKLSSWLPGANNLSAAEFNCSRPGLTKGSKVAVTQYVSRQIDYDYSCIE
jgi:hypothetical protein